MKAKYVQNLSDKDVEQIVRNILNNKVEKLKIFRENDEIFVTYKNPHLNGVHLADCLIVVADYLIVDNNHYIDIDEAEDYQYQYIRFMYEKFGEEYLQDCIEEKFKINKLEEKLVDAKAAASEFSRKITTKQNEDIEYVEEVEY